MLSRVAESIYWMSRYLERAENLARIMDVQHNVSLDLPGSSGGNWAALVQTSGDHADFAARYPSEARHHVIQFLAFDPANPNSMTACVNAARENARSIREIISPELWTQINRLYHTLRQAPDPSQDEQRLYGFFTGIKMMGLSFGGIVNDTMAHTEGWHWFRCGRLLERADKTSRILDVKYFTLLPSARDVGTPLDQIQWTGLLKSTSALEVYRSQYGTLSRENIIEFLVLNREFPRSVLHCLNRADDSLRWVLGTFPNHFQNPAEQQLGQLCAELSYTGIDAIIRCGLHEFVDQLQVRLNRIADAIRAVYFAK